MKILSYTISTFALVVFLSACSTQEPHSICIDEKSTTDYIVAWQGLLADAKEAGKITIKDVVRIQGDSYSKFSYLKNKDWTSYCNLLDKLQKENNF